MIRNLLIPGRPVPKGSKRALGRGVMIESSAKGLNVWMKALRAELHTAMRGEKIAAKPFPVAVDLRFYIRPPIRTVRRRPTVPPDLDKLVRAVLDSMQGVVFEDDAQVTSIYARKVYITAATPSEKDGGVLISAVRADWLT